MIAYRLILLLSFFEKVCKEDIFYFYIFNKIKTGALRQKKVFFFQFFKKEEPSLSFFLSFDLIFFQKTDTILKQL